MDSREFGRFLLSRRARVTPAEVGLVVSGARRAAGLRREEVAELASMSADYYRRLEQARVAPPSAQIVLSIGRVLRLDRDEQDYLLRLAGHEPSPTHSPVPEVAFELRQLVAAMGHNPAQVMTLLGETLVQNEAAVALMGRQTHFTGYARNTTYRWFMDPSTRIIHPVEEHDEESHARVAELRARAVTDPSAGELIGVLRARSAEFERVWQSGAVAICRSGLKTFVHPKVGTLDLAAQILRLEGTGQLVVTFTAAPGSADAAKLTAMTAL
jgi:transcriptional regulator with XRE-family HTH domain